MGSNLVLNYTVKNGGKLDGIENQTHVHYVMPVRNMIYDSLQFAKQVLEVAAKHKRNKEHKGAAEC